MTMYGNDKQVSKKWHMAAESAWTVLQPHSAVEHGTLMDLKRQLGGGGSFGRFLLNPHNHAFVGTSV
jgi:hypothetical protein